MAAVLAAISQVWPNNSIDLRDPAGVWANALAHLSENQIRHGLSQISTTTERFAPTPGQFRAMCIGRAYDQPAPRMPALPTRGGSVESERDLAEFHTRVLFAHRITGFKAPETWTRPFPADFDYRGVIYAAPKPKSTAVDDHRRAWAKLIQIFNSEWSAYEQRQP